MLTAPSATPTRTSLPSATTAPATPQEPVAAPAASPESEASGPSPAQDTHTAASAEDLKNTPYQQIKNSPLGRFVRENKLVTTGATVGASIVVGGGAAQSSAFADVARYGIVPALGASVAIVGAAAVHDAVANDFGKHNLRAASKVAVGTTAALGGAQVVGMAYDIPVLDHALSGTLEKVFDNGLAIAGAGVIAGGVAAGRFAAGRAIAAANHAEHRAANVALAATGAGASGAAVLGGLEMIGRQYNIPGVEHVFTHTVDYLSQSAPAAVAAGTLLLAGSGVLVGEAIQNVRKGGNDLVTVAEGLGAVTAGMGGLELVGHGLQIEALEGVLTRHVDTVASAALAGAGVALTRVSADSIKENGLHIKNATGATAGAAMTLGGVSAGLGTFGLSPAAELAGRGAGVVGGLGLGAMTYVLGRDAIRDLRQGDLLHASARLAASGATATGSLLTVGESLNIPALTDAADTVAHATVIPLWNHVIEPAATFLFQNPVAGGAVIAVGVGAAYALYRHHHPQGA